MMKKLIYLIMVVGLVFTSCEPMDDIHAALDAQENIVVGDAEYTLTGDDYDDLELGYGSFSSEDDAKADIPDLLAEMFPVWGKGSSVLVGYQLYIGNAFGVDEYTLIQDDYTTSGSDLLGFQSDAKPEDFLGDILATNITGADNGDYAVTNYFQFSGAAYTITPTVTFEENFDFGDTAGDITATSAGVWVAHSSSGYNPAEYATTSLSMDGYPTSDIGGSIVISSSKNEDVNTTFAAPVTSGKVFASTLISINAVGDGSYFFHLMDDSYGYSARVGAKDDGSGNILFGIGATSSTLTYSTTSFDLNTTYLLVSSYDIASGISNLYVLTEPMDTEPSTPEASNTGDANKGIQRIGVRQSSDGPSATLDGIRVANTWSAIMSNDVLDDEVIGDKTAGQMLYNFNGSTWELSEDGSYLLASEDYDTMGTDYGQPGKYNNFDSSMDIDAYISTFLGIKYPFAQDDDNIDVLYKYYSSNSGPQTRGNSYTYMNGAWMAYESTISTTLQFGHDGISWVPDNTIKYTLTGADYTYIADQLTGNPDYDNVSLTNLSNYSDFDYNWTDAQLLYSMSILADYLNPTAEEGQKYVFTYLLYDNGINTLTMSLIKTNGAWVLNN